MGKKNFVLVKTLKNGKTITYKNKGLTTGKTYQYKVEAYRGNYNGEKSNVVSAKTTLGKMSGVKAAKTGYAAVKISWKKVPGAKKYTVYRATSKNGKYKKIATTSKLTYTNKNLKKGKVYYYKVKAVAKNTAANSAFSTVDKCKVKR